MKTGAFPRRTLLVMAGSGEREGGPVLMLHVGLDLSRTRVDVHVLDETGAPVLVTRSAPDSGGVGSLVSRGGRGGPRDGGGWAARAPGGGGCRPAGGGGDRVDARPPLRPRPAGAARLG